MATMHDVAKRAGVSIGTVSRYVNDSGYVGADTRERIRAAIAAVGYVPNGAARSLATKRTGLIGFVVSDLVNPFSAELAHGIAERAAHHGYCMVSGVSDNSEDRAIQTLRTLREHRVDGMIVTPPETPRIRRELEELCHAGTPLVLVGMRLPGRIADRVTTATYSGARQAVNHLIGLGHRRIGLVTGSRRRKIAMGRFRGYRDALSAAGIAINDALVAEVSLDRAGGADALAMLLARGAAPTAMFAVNDAAALGVMQEAARRRIRVPRALSVVGFDDVDIAAHSVPSLTTVRQPKREMGAIAVDLLLARIRGTAPSQAIQRRLACDLVVRSSTAPPVSNNERKT